MSVVHFKPQFVYVHICHFAGLYDYGVEKCATSGIKVILEMSSGFESQTSVEVEGENSRVLILGVMREPQLKLANHASRN